MFPSFSSGTDLQPATLSDGTSGNETLQPIVAWLSDQGPPGAWLTEGVTPTLERQNLITAMQRLPGQSALVSTCYALGDEADSDSPEYSGRYADIYKGKVQGQVVCLKSIRRTQQTDIDHLAKAFSKAAIIWGKVAHPNILPFYGVFSYKNTISFVSPWMENGNISTFLEKHRDSNRAILRNILINNLERACIGDFGLSSATDKEIMTLNYFTSITPQNSTARWQAPELFNPETEEAVRVTEESDIYAFACVAYEIFAGEVPFAELTRETTIIYEVLRDERPSRPATTSLSWGVWGLTEGVWSSMKNCWSGDPAKRPAIDKVIEELEKALSPNVERNVGHGDYLLPSQFRELTRLEGIDSSVEGLESLLE
ncbi:hypothetical protein DXG01_008517 [Tephrocybe rancida]|nr:hypothetical protein DXG01_008517 [Tephrocybe rancida]